MARTKTAYVCEDCGSEYSKWQGQCTACKAWNTLIRISVGSSNDSPSVQADFRHLGANSGRKQGYTGQLSAVQDLSEIDVASVPPKVKELLIVKDLPLARVKPSTV